MLKRTFTWIGVLVFLLTLTAPTFVQAEPYAYSEGVFFFSNRGTRISSTSISVTATKMVAGAWRETWVHVRFRGADTDNRWYVIDDRAKLMPDPDCAEVSPDLGWGGLCGYVMAYEQNTQSYVRIEFNVSQPALVRNYSYDPSTYQFRREADLRGWMRVGSRVIDFDKPLISRFQEREGAYNFSDQWPGY